MFLISFTVIASYILLYKTTGLRSFVRLNVAKYQNICHICYILNDILETAKLSPENAIQFGKLEISDIASIFFYTFSVTLSFFSLTIIDHYGGPQLPRRKKKGRGESRNLTAKVETSRRKLD